MIKTAHAYSMLSKRLQLIIVVAFIVFMIIKITCFGHVDLIDLPNLRELEKEFWDEQHDHHEQQLEDRIRERNERQDRDSAPDFSERNGD